MALAANVTPAPYYDPAYPIGEREYGANAADEYYRGAIVCKSAGAVIGLTVVDNADADTTLGVSTKRVTVTAQNDVVYVAVAGVWWFACANFETANLWGLFAPAAGSDDPADLDDLGAGTPSALGTLVHNDATGVSGWLDLCQRVVVLNS
jgi:hypothetical protein